MSDNQKADNTWYTAHYSLRKPLADIVKFNISAVL
jgi:hypothetical protein